MSENVVTLDTSQASSSALKAVAHFNMASIMVSCETSHWLSDWEKARALENIKAMSVTCNTSPVARD